MSGSTTIQGAFLSQNFTFHKALVAAAEDEKDVR